MARNFLSWLNTFRPSISGYGYYIDFTKVFTNIDEQKVELNILNSLVGSKNIEKDFHVLISKYPECLKCIPLLLAVRSNEIFAQDEDGAFWYQFSSPTLSLEQYSVFMKKTGLFDLIANHIISNLVDYVTGVEVGLDSNGRKNRGGHQMEDLVESFIVKAGFKKGATYFKEMYLYEIENKWHMNLSTLSNDGTSTKRFDFVLVKNDTIYAIETNFYASGGSKLNETARSYKMLAEESRNIPRFTFMWITDGVGWTSAKGNLKETFDALPLLYNIKDLENGILKNL